MCGCLSHTPYWGTDLASNPGMCPDWESNQQLFGSQAHAQSTELHQSGPQSFFLNIKKRAKVLVNTKTDEQTGK